MGILNVTPDSFSDGGHYSNVDAALRRAETMIEDGVDLIDVGGESTRPGSQRIDAGEEADRTAPIVAAIAKRFDIPISIDTTKAAVARANLDAGAEIINDISGLRWEESLARIAAERGAGLVLMHSRGEFETMHSQPPVDDIFAEVIRALSKSVDTARAAGVADDQLVLDIGIGFGKTAEQNLELIANLDKFDWELKHFPLLVGASRKSFIGKITGEDDPERRLAGSLAAAVFAGANGARIVRVHDVRETVHALRVTGAIEQQRR